MIVLTNVGENTAYLDIGEVLNFNKTLNKEKSPITLGLVITVYESKSKRTAYCRSCLVTLNLLLYTNILPSKAPVS